MSDFEFNIVNPFTPGFGHVPHIIIGRDELIAKYRDALRHGYYGSPYFSILLKGARGTGKSVLLGEFRKIAKEENWFVINENATQGLYNRIRHQLDGYDNSVVSNTGEFSGSIGNSLVASGSGNVSHAVSHAREGDTLTKLVEKKFNKDMSGEYKGLVICIDEINPTAIDDLRLVATQVDSLNGDDYHVSIIAAGLQHNIEVIDSDTVISFLRRMKKCVLGRIDIYNENVPHVISETFKQSGFNISDMQADALAQFSDGYPYAIQLFSSYAWESAYQHIDETTDILDTDITHYIDNAMNDLYLSIIKQTWNALDVNEQDFIRAIFKSRNTQVRKSTIAKRIGLDKKTTDKIAERLIDEGAIDAISTATGETSEYVRSTIPMMRIYIEKGAEPFTRINNIPNTKSASTESSKALNEWIRKHS